MGGSRALSRRFLGFWSLLGIIGGWAWFILGGAALALGKPGAEVGWGADSAGRGRRYFWLGAGIAYGVVYAAPMLSWYDWRSAHGWRWFDDGVEWKQVDKVGHAWTTFQLSRIGYLSAQTAGYPPQKALWIATALAWGYQATIEIADGFFPKWGASAWDLVGNTAGSLLFLFQQKVLQRTLWDIDVKFSFHPTPYAAQRPDVFGRGASQLLKDYNGQTYWLCLYYRRWPVGLAVGYGASGLLGSYGVVPWDEIAARERRRWIFSLEPYWPFWIRCRGWGLILLTGVKLPFPALVYENRKATLVGLYF